MKSRPVVVWGHRPRAQSRVLSSFLPPHTHSYIHKSYYKAFSALGFETYWVNSPKEIDSDVLKRAIVFTEDQVDENLPVFQSAEYVTHHSTKDKYLESGIRRLNLCNFVMDLTSGESYNYPGSRVERIDDVTFFDSRNSALYQPWATDLLPGQERAFQPLVVGRGAKDLNYIGTVNHDGLKPKFDALKVIARSYGLNFRAFKGKSDEETRRLIRSSSFAFDLRGQWHLERGYIPCRIWKSMSYGRAVSSNSISLESVFGSRVHFPKFEAELVPSAIEIEGKTGTLDEIKDNQNWVMSQHTFLNRANAVLDALQNI